MRSRRRVRLALLVVGAMLALTACDLDRAQEGVGSDVVLDSQAVPPAAEPEPAPPADVPAVPTPETMAPPPGSVPTTQPAPTEAPAPPVAPPTAPEPEPAPEPAAPPPPPAPEPEPAPPPATPGLSGEEQQIVDLVNQARAAEGLDPYGVRDDQMAHARSWSAQMAADRNMRHDDLSIPDGCFTAGENVAAGQRSVEEVVDAWMDSPGHRANILSDRFTDIGVGVARAGDGARYWTQNFVGCR